MGLYGVDAFSVKIFEREVLFELFEKKFYLPSPFIYFDDFFRIKLKIIGQECRRLFLVLLPDKESKVIQNTVGNIFSGQVVGETAKSLSERFGKVLQKRQSMTINRNDKSTSISTQLDSLIPASKISTLTQGMFVGSVSDNFDERIEQKIFHAEIVVDNEKVAAESKAYQQIPQILSFVNEQSEDKMKQEIESNYKQIKADILNIVSSEMERIKNDPNLQHLVQKE